MLDFEQATLHLFVARIRSPGTLKVFPLTDSIRGLEGQVSAANLVFNAAGNPLATVHLEPGDEETVLSLDITAAVLRVPFQGLVLYANDGLDASFDSREGPMKPVVALRHPLVPVGAIMAFAMENPPEGYLECDGREVKREVYPRLFGALGTLHGPGDGATTFNLPDLRGRFARGWNHGAGRDPDVSWRSEAPGSDNPGDRVGSLQEDGFENHIHDFVGRQGATNIDFPQHTHELLVLGVKTIAQGEFPIPTLVYGPGGTVVGNLHTGLPSSFHGHLFLPEGSITSPQSGRHTGETRGKNASVLYCIKY